MSAGEPTNTLIWEAEFPTLEEAQQALILFEGDGEHEALFKLQGPLIESARVEFYENR